MNLAGNLRRAAQSIRHLPLLNRCTVFWDRVRPAYRSAIGLASNGKGVQVTVAGINVQVHPDFCSTGFESMERDSYEVLKRLLKPEHVFFDVGGAIGSYTMVAASIITSSGRIVVFEPDPTAASYLRKHLAWNQLSERVLLREIACGRKPGTTELYVSDSDVGGQASILPLDGFHKIPVASTSIDEECRNTGLTPNFIKIDVEGAEWDVLLGAEETLRRAKPTLLVSVHPASLESLGIPSDRISEWLTELGYICSVVARDHEIHLLAETLKSNPRPSQSVNEACES